MKPEMENEELSENGASAESPNEETPEAGAEAAAEPTETERELQALKQIAEEHYQRFLRTQADFDNFRKRTRQEKEELAKYASQKVIEGLLPIVDNFERALAASKEQQDIESLTKGVEMIYRQLGQLMENEGLQAIEAVGQPFNPELHQAVMQSEAEDGTESGIVVEELQKGYKLKDKIIRPAMVKVSQ